MAIATEKCNVSFQIRYTSSIPATGASAVLKYRIKGSTGLYAQYNIPSVPNGGTIDIPNVQASDDYEYILDLTANGVTVTKTDFFQVGRCSPPYCEIPDIKRVYLGEKDQILMEYAVDEKDLYAVEYQIATDNKFTKIVHVRVIMGSDYKPMEYIEMNDGTINNETVYYIRARRHCSASVVSAWSNVIEFRSGKWSSQKVLDVNCLANFDDFDNDICFGVRGVAWNTQMTLNTSVPNIGSLIYLTNGKIATIENLKSFDQAMPERFKNNGIRWIRFSSVTPNMVYLVKPETAEILEAYFDCSQS